MFDTSDHLTLQKKKSIVRPNISELLVTYLCKIGHYCVNHCAILYYKEGFMNFCKKLKIFL